MLDREDYERYRSIIKNGLPLDRELSINSLTFLGDMQDKFNKFRQETYVSDKQVAFFERLEAQIKEVIGDDAWEAWEEGDD